MGHFKQSCCLLKYDWTIVVSTTEIPTTTYSTTTAIPPTTSLPPRFECEKYEEKMSYKDSSNCTSVTPVTKSLCYGECRSSVIYDAMRGMSINNCFCCRPVHTKKVQTQLKCPDGSKKTFSYLTFAKCSCRRCDRSSFTDVPFLKSASPYTTLRVA